MIGAIWQPPSNLRHAFGQKNYFLNCLARLFSVVLLGPIDQKRGLVTYP